MLEQTKKNPICVISIETFGEHKMHDIQTNSSWHKNPYDKNYAVVPDDMVNDIIGTRGFCDITLNEDKTEITSFVAREIPNTSSPKTPEPSALEQLRADIDYIALMKGVDL